MRPLIVARSADHSAIRRPGGTMDRSAIADALTRPTGTEAPGSGDRPAAYTGDRRSALLAAAVFVQCEFRQENPGGQDANRLVMAEREPVLIAGDDDAGFRGDRSRDHMIVVGVAAGRADIRQRGI